MMLISKMVGEATDNGNTRHAVGMDQWRTMNSSGRIRATTEVNFKSIMRAFVFGEDPRVINPGDMLLEMSQSEPGDRDQKNVRKFEITINGNQMAGLLAQITRAADLYKVNEEWLRTPVTTTIEPTYQSVQQKYAEDMAKLDLQRIKKPAPKLTRAR
jgi:hypothetical protein